MLCINKCILQSYNGFVCASLWIICTEFSPVAHIKLRSQFSVKELKCYRQVGGGLLQVGTILLSEIFTISVMWYCAFRIVTSVEERICSQPFSQILEAFVIIKSGFWCLHKYILLQAKYNILAKNNTLLNRRNVTAESVRCFTLLETAKGLG